MESKISVYEFGHSLTEKNIIITLLLNYVNIFIYPTRLILYIYIFQYINKTPKTLINDGIKIPHQSFKPEIEFKDITFSYPTRPEQVKLT